MASKSTAQGTWEKQAHKADSHVEETAGGRAMYDEFVAAVKTLVNMLRDHRSGEFKLSNKELVLLIGTLAYVVNPFDAAPEAVLGPLGLADDAGAVALALGGLAAAIVRYRTAGKTV